MAATNPPRKRRPYEFSEKVKRDARFRQWGMCATCGEDLADSLEFAHHVVPNQSGEPTLSSHDFVRESDNCVIVCDECHEGAHGGNTRTGGVADYDQFPHSHGTAALNKTWKKEHLAWVSRMQAQALIVWNHRLANPKP